jgi:hypothetical protein
MGRSAAAISVPPSIAWLGGAALALAVVALYVYGSSAYPLTEPDEARYAEIAREMLVRRDWITPHLNFVKYFEKPPLVYWATAAAFTAFGVNELSARLPSLLSGIGTIALTVWLAARMYGAPTALLALPILALGPLFGFMAQTLTLDMSLTLLMTLAMVGVWCAFDSSPALPAAPGAVQRRWFASPMPRRRSPSSSRGRWLPCWWVPARCCSSRCTADGARCARRSTGGDSRWRRRSCCRGSSSSAGATLSSCVSSSSISTSPASCGRRSTGSPSGSTCR